MPLGASPDGSAARSRAILARSLRRAALAAAALFAPAAGAQNAWPATPDQAHHVAIVRAERTASLLAEWREADARRRAAAAELLAAERSPGAPEGRLPSLSTLALATRVLRGADPAEARADGLQRFADSLDLQVVPGAFRTAAAGAAAEEDGEPLTVRFYRLHDGPFRADVVLGLLWIGPDGSEARARTEPIAARHFDPPGNRMYLRAPRAAEEGWWRLVPEVAAEGRRVRGLGVLVAARAPATLEGWKDLAAAGDRGRADLLERGMRAALLLAAGHPLARPFPSLAAGHPPFALPSAAGDPARGGDPENELRIRTGWGEPAGPGPVAAGRPVRRIFLLPVPAEECAEAVFLGPVGEAWQDLAREQGAPVCAVEVGAKGGEAFARLVAGWRASLPSGDRGEVIVVARGAAVTALPFLLAGREVAIDGFVLAPERSGRPQALPPGPTLVVSGAALAGDPAAGLAVVQDGDPLVVRDLALPGRIAAWLAERERE
ncbi:MAG: hypothetical protein AB1726_15455 [Planctomycetota bacterium]